MSTLDQTLLQQLQYALIEAPDGGQSWLSGLWTREEILSVANQRQDRLLFDTLLILTSTSLAVGIGDTSIALPANWLRTILLIWRGDDGVNRELQRSDAFEADHAILSWQTTNGLPIVYMDDDHPGSLVVRIAPGPTVTGTLTLVYAAAGTSLTGNGVSLTVPDELAHAVKYGTLAALLSKDGRGRDDARATYCQSRVDLAVQASQIILNGWS
jgi:hypothetical protein